MNESIYQIFVANNSIAGNLAWKALSEDERKALQEKERASREAVGAEAIVFCDSAWADEAHPWWGVLQFPDLQARIEHTRTLQRIGWLDLVNAFTLLGMAMSGPETLNISNPIYKLWVIKNNPAGVDDPDSLWAIMREKHDALYQECNSQVLLICDSNWCSEAYPVFGLSAYPDIDSNRSIQAGLDKLGWRKRMESITYLGIPMAFP
jgi:hypothetical protein